MLIFAFKKKKKKLSTAIALISPLKFSPETLLTIINNFQCYCLKHIRSIRTKLFFNAYLSKH